MFLQARTTRLHRHDFPEIFWIERGKGRHYINGQVKNLNAGDLVCVRPEDRHRLEARDRHGFVLINLAYQPRMRAELLQRYPEELSFLLAANDSLPFRAELSSARMNQLRDGLSGLRRNVHSRLGLEHFLLGLHEMLLPAAVADLPAMPNWLQHACEEVRRPDVFAQGVAGMVRAAGRSAEHLARTMRAVLGTTPSAYLNQVRMEYAARELRSTSRPIVDIILDCGLANLSHFYALFRAAHGTTPHVYRRRHQRLVA
jgi:AraC family cel operon transcriptional repressor